jgi:hypothetical protein
VKRLTFIITVEDLPDHAKDYRVQGAICTAATQELRHPMHGYGKVNVIVAPASHIVEVQAESDAAFRMEARPA